MTDRLSRERRSWNMSRIRSRDTKPEKIVRSILHRMGYRFRLHQRYLPGSPDIVLPRYRVAIFVHGCFWHRHVGCRYAYTPKSRSVFWTKKFKDNVERDKRNHYRLKLQNWYVEVIWECETTDPNHLTARLDRILRRK